MSFSGKKWALLRSTCRGTSVVLSSSHCFPSSQLSKKLKIYPSAAQKSIVQAKLRFPSGAQKHREKRRHFLPAGLSSSLQCWCTGPVPDTPLSLPTGRLQLGAQPCTLLAQMLGSQSSPCSQGQKQAQLSQAGHMGSSASPEHVPRQVNQPAKGKWLQTRGGVHLQRAMGGQVGLLAVPDLP